MKIVHKFDLTRFYSQYMSYCMNNIRAFRKGLENAHEIFETIEHKPTIDVLSDRGADIQTIDSEIVFDNVSYKYTGANMNSLSECSFVVKPKSFTAITGPSG